jgi:glycosyltransferase involved in cell wall biosynthesis
VGPRTHVLGVISAFKALGWDVRTFIVGDRVPLNWVMKGSEKQMRRSKSRVLLADLMRLSMGFVNAQRAYYELGRDVSWVYERFAAFQSLGKIFKKNQIPWVLETNAPLFVESKSDRQTIILNRLARYLELKAYRNCDILVCISETLRDIIVEQAGISPKKVIVMPNGVDVSFFDPTCYQSVRIFDGFTVGFVGNLASWQGLDLLLDATNELVKEGLDINLVLVGDGPDRKYLEEKTGKLALSDHVRFVGFVPQETVPEYIAGFDVGYTGQTRRTVGDMYCSPIKLYEYMAMAKPAIASNYEDTRRVIKRGVGFLFEIGSKHDLKRVLTNAYQAGNNLTQMGCRARAEIVANHSWEARVSTLTEAVERCLKSHHGICRQ